MAIFCCFILSALFSSALTQPVNDEFQFDPFHHQQLNYTNLGLKETLELLKMFVNTAESKRVRRAATPGNLLSVIGGGEKLVKLFEILGEAFVNSFQSAVNELKRKIKEVNKSIAELSKEEAEKVPKALQKLSEVQTRFVNAKQQFISLAQYTISQVNIVIKGLDGVHQGAQHVNERALNFLSDFESLLVRSTETLKRVAQNFEQINSKLGEINGILITFKSGIRARYEHKKNSMNNWIKHTREKVYGGCAASAVFWPAVPVCYSIAAGVLETEIKNYKKSVSRLKKMSEMTNVELSKILVDSKSQFEHIMKELVITEIWKEKVISTKDYFKTLFDEKDVTDEVLLDFFDIRGGRGGIDGGKEITRNKLKVLANVAKAYLNRDHFIPPGFVCMEKKEEYLCRGNNAAGSTKEKSKEACALRCYGTPTCMAWTFGTLAPPDNCWLKTTTTCSSAALNTNWAWGTRGCHYQTGFEINIYCSCLFPGIYLSIQFRAPLADWMVQ